MKIQNIYLACFVHRHAVSPRDPTPEIALQIRVHFFGCALYLANWFTSFFEAFKTLHLC